MLHQFQRQPLNECLRRDAECVSRRECARTVATTVRPVQSIQDFVIFPVLNFITENSITGSELTVDQKALLRFISIVHSH